MTRALLCVMAAASALTAQAPDPREIMTRAVTRDQMNWEKAKAYTYFSRTTVRETDSKGNITKTERKVNEVLILFGQPYEKLIEKDGKPLTGKDLAKEQEKLDKLLAKRQKETESERAKRLADFEKERRQQREFAREIPKAFTFQMVGEEQVGGRRAWIIDAKPRPEFRSTVRHAHLLNKFEGRMWVDQAENQLVRVDAKAIDTVSFGLFLARIGKGTRFYFEQTRVNDEVWMPKAVKVTLDARLGLIKHLQGDVDVQFDGFRKFQTDSKIVSTAEVRN